MDDPQQQEEIVARMDWLEAPQKGRELLPLLADFMQDMRQAGYTHALLLGMGGSSLAPEVMAETFGEPTGETFGLELAILDSTDPVQVRAAELRSPVNDTLYIVSSKSGSTSEINAFFNYFWAKAVQAFGERAGEHFIAITDPGTSLANLAEERNFRKVFHADPRVGGRNSALTAFGLVPAALIGIDVEKLLDRAEQMADQCRPNVPAGRNPGLVLGAVIGEATLQGRDKITVLTDPELVAFGSWLEQLIAESSGKEGRGIIPVDLEPPQEARSYSSDRLFAYVRMSGDAKEKAASLLDAGYPVPTIDVQVAYDLGAEFYRWEVATAIATSIIGVNSFNQPDVQDAKDRTRQKIQIYQQTGSLDEGEAIWEGDGGKVYGRAFSGLEQAASLADVVHRFVRHAGPGDYVAINAYLPRNPRTIERLQKLRQSIQNETGRATTLGFGPRFLHSTGQLHKGGPNNGLFLEITSEPGEDIDIPTHGLTFGTLERAQALGDLEALLARDRRAIRIHLEDADIEDLIG